MPPPGVVMLPWLTTLPATAPSVKRMRPARKSASDRFSVDARNPATSICAPAPIVIPFGLTRNTRPLDCSEPSMADGLRPTTRFSTLLDCDCWMKRVISLPAIENPCQ